MSLPTLRPQADALDALRQEETRTDARLETYHLFTQRTVVQFWTSFPFSYRFGNLSQKECAVGVGHITPF